VTGGGQGLWNAGVRKEDSAALVEHLEQCLENGYGHGVLKDTVSADIEYMTEDDLKKIKKDKKLVKRLGKKYHAFVASDTLIRVIPRLLGPGLNRMGKFPTRVSSDAELSDAIAEVESTVKFQMKKVLCLNVPIGHVGMEHDDLARNVKLAGDFLSTLTKKGWQNIKVLYIKSTMGPPQIVYL